MKTKIQILTDFIVKSVCDYYGTSFDMVKNTPTSGRNRNTIYPRQVIEYCIYTLVKGKYNREMTIGEIGLITGTHYATILNSISVIANDIYQKNELGVGALIIYNRVKLSLPTFDAKYFDLLAEITVLENRLLHLKELYANQYDNIALLVEN